MTVDHEAGNGLLKYWQVMSVLAIFLIGWGSIHTQVKSIESSVALIESKINAGILPRAEERITSLEKEISELQQEIYQRTQDRYTGTDGQRFENYVNRRLDDIDANLDRCCRNGQN